MLFSLSVRKWGNRTVISRDAKQGMIKVEEVPDEQKQKELIDALRVTKKLLVSDKLEAVNKTLDEAQAWCISRAMISTIRKGVYLVKRSMIEEFENKLEQVNKMVQKEMLPAFFEEYDICKEAAKKKLGPLFNADDYPTVDELRQSYRLEWNWFGLSVPNTLPEEIRERECKKLKETYEKAMIEVRIALREGLKKLIAHAVERLEVKSGTEVKIFRDKSMLKNFNEFFDTFNARDMTNDVELAKVMQEARKIVDKFDADAVRENVEVRNEIANKFDEVNKKLDGMLTDKPSRRFQFDDE